MPGRGGMAAAGEGGSGDAASLMPPRKPGRRGAGAQAAPPRGPRTRVRSKKLKESSRRWLERHMNDPWVKRAQAEGWRSRAAFKLIEADERYDLLRRGRRVVDLGAAPGGWSQVAAKRVGTSENAPLVAGIDLLPVEPVAGVRLFEKDFLDDDAEATLLAALDGAPDLVLSDMAVATVGHRRTDHLRTQGIAEVAADFATRVLAPGGDFLMKTFQGGTERELLDALRRAFTSVHHFKPESSRKESPELYLVARGFRGVPPEGGSGA